MATPLHDPDALRALADTPDGPARDWACTLLATRGIDAGLPSDVDGARIALAAGAAPGPLLTRVLSATTRTQLGLAAQLCDELCRFGAVPLGEAEQWIPALVAAVRGRGWASDASFARLLAELGHHDPAVVSAAARVEERVAVPLLPRIVLGFVATRGPVTGVAAELAAPLAARMARDPDLLPDTLAALGVPRSRAERPIADLDTALFVGGSLAGIDETPPVSVGKGAARRRMQQAALELLAEGPESLATALVRGLLEHDGVDAGQLLVAATWLRTVPEAPPVEAVLDHGAGEDPRVLTLAAVETADAPTLNLSISAAYHRDPPSAVLAARRLVRETRGRDLVEDALSTRAATALDEPRLQAALAVALARDPTPVVRWLADDRLRPLALHHARHTAHEEILAELLAWRRPESPNERSMLAKALAAQGDPAALRALAQLREETGDEALDPELARARAIVAG
jgi:hypothetical protein